jgi:DNA-binding HxlR family transcriptional regulator
MVAFLLELVSFLYQVNYRAWRKMQGGTEMAPGHHEETACLRISELLSRVGDKWTLLVVRTLGAGPARFNALRRAIGDISQKMLATTLRNLERDGFVSRTVTATAPPQVEYALTALGRDLLGPVCALAQWTVENSDRIETARRDFDARGGAPAVLRPAEERDFSRA